MVRVMTLLESIILGIVEGLTEFLPVSSTGHLIIAQNLLGLAHSDAMKAFEICIQGGAILAVLGLYSNRVEEMLNGLRGRDPKGLRLVINMIVGFLPAAILGLLFNDFIKNYLFNAHTVITTWVLGGFVILAYVKIREKSGDSSSGKPLHELQWKGALGVGLLQSVAMCPGTSRSLMTMLGGLFVGLSVSAAVEFSFLLGLITLGAATVHDAVKHGAEMVETIGWEAIVAGTITAWASALIAVKWMVGYLNKHSLSIFGWYRIAAGIIMLLLVISGMVEVSQDEDPAVAAAPTVATTAP